MTIHKGDFMMYKTLLFEQEGRIATLTLNRPNAMNAMDETMMEELADILDELRGNKSVQVLIIKGEGRAF